jgi:predicted DNA-binding protein (MmcQ/YjbR family)
MNIVLQKGVTSISFDQDTLVFKVGGKMFALSLANGREYDAAVNLKCEPERTEHNTMT